MSESGVDYEAESELECLVQSLEKVISCKQSQQKAYDQYDGYSPGWALSHINDEVKDSVCEFGNYLGKVIDRRVKMAIRNASVT